jgi:uncharacterized protein (TIGR02996 family)
MGHDAGPAEMPVTHDDAFLQAIIESPDDDGPRLVYADWLEDHSEPERAEFIRVQCELARLPEDTPQRARLAAREQALLGEHGRAWARPLPGWATSWEFRRGFVEGVTASPEAFLAHADSLFRASPIRRVTFQTAALQLARPHLVFPSAGPLLPRLTACPHLARLSAIGFPHNLIGDDGVAALASSRCLGRLSLLDLRSNALTEAGVVALAGSANCSGLATLLLASNRIGPAGAWSLARSPHLTRLTCLNLGENPLRDEGVQALAGSPNLCGLTSLGLAGSGLGTGGARALAASPHLHRLEWLDVRDNAIGNKARQELRLRFGKGKVRF